MAGIVDDAVCIRQWDFSETSQTVALFTRKHGMIRALAKGSKRPKSPFSGGIELLTRGEAVYLERRTGLHLLTSWDLREMYSGLRRSLEAHRAGLYVAELMYLGVTDHDPHEALFDVLIDAMAMLSGSEAGGGQRGGWGGVQEGLLRFQWGYVCETGVQPDLEQRDEEAEGRDEPLVFSPGLGRLVGTAYGSGGRQVGAAEGAEVGNGGGGGGWPIRVSTVELMRRLGQGAEVGEVEDAEGIVRANRFLAAYIRHVLGREPNTFSVVFGSEIPRS